MEEKIEIEKLCALMEEMANMPDTGPPVRQPGERNMYELQNEREYKKREEAYADAVIKNFVPKGVKYTQLYP